MPDNLTTTTQVDPAIGLFYDKVLLRRGKPKLIHRQFAQKKSLPKKGGTTIKFRRYAQLAVATTPLAEGVTPNGKRLSKTDLTAQASQYGDYVHVTDVVDLTVEDAVLTIAAEELGDQMGRTLDQLTRDVLVACASVTTMSTGGTVLNQTDLDTIVQTLMNNNADTMTALVKPGTGVGTAAIGQAYWALGDTVLWNDLKLCADWVDVKDYPSQQSVMDAEVGSTGKIRWQLTSEGYVSSSYYSCPILGKNAFGVVDIEGGNAKNIVKAFGSGGTGDPLNQRATSGWKLWDVTRILNDNFMHIARCTDG